jgi:hypothetical protein
MVRVTGVIHPPPPNDPFFSQLLFREDEMNKIAMDYVGKPAYVEHETWNPPVGKVVQVGYTPSGNVACVIDVDPRTPQGKEVMEGLKNGTYKSFSVGVWFKCDRDRTSFHDPQVKEISFCQEGALPGTLIASYEDPEKPIVYYSASGLEVFYGQPEFDEYMRKLSHTRKVPPAGPYFGGQRRLAAQKYSHIPVPIITSAEMTTLENHTVVMQASASAGAAAPDTTETSWENDIVQLEFNDLNFKRLKETLVQANKALEDLNKRELQKIQAEADATNAELKAELLGEQGILMQASVSVPKQDVEQLVEFQIESPWVKNAEEKQRVIQHNKTLSGIFTGFKRTHEQMSSKVKEVEAKLAEAEAKLSAIYSQPSHDAFRKDLLPNMARTSGVLVQNSVGTTAKPSGSWMERTKHLTHIPLVSSMQIERVGQPQ